MKSRKEKKAEREQTAVPPRGEPQVRRWLPMLFAFLIAIAVVAGGSFALFNYLLPSRIPEEMVGEWRVVGGDLSGMTLEFERNGRMTGRSVLKGIEREMEGEAHVTGTTLRTTTKNPLTGKSATGIQTIISLTETELVTEDQKGT